MFMLPYGDAIAFLKHHSIVRFLAPMQHQLFYAQIFQVYMPAEAHASTPVHYLCATCSMGFQEEVSMKYSVCRHAQR